MSELKTNFRKKTIEESNEWLNEILEDLGYKITKIN